MKTNILKHVIFVLSLLFILVSCNSDFLNEINPNESTEDTYWQTQEEAESALATVYSPVRGQMYGYFGAFTGFQNQNVRGDDVWSIQDDPQTWDIANFTNDSNTGRLPDDWEWLYRGVGRANVFLANIGRVVMDEELKSQFIGEAYFLRAFNYFMLVINWGDIPLRLAPISNTSEVMAATVAEKEIWAQIEADLKEAKARLPIERPAKEKGRITKGAAIAYLGKAYVYQKKFAEAKTQLEEIMKAPYNYGLVPDCDDNYTNSNEFNEESIFELNYAKFGSAGAWGSEGANSIQGNVLPQFIGSPLTGGWFKYLPSASIIEEFIKEERPKGSDSKFDKRMYTCFYFKYSDYGDVRPDATWYGSNNITMDQLWTSTEGKRAGNEPVYPVINGKPGRFLPRKHTSFWKDGKEGDSMYNSEPIDNNYRVMRYAEVLLLHAEAAAKTGDITAASKDVNRIRVRAGLSEKAWGSATDIMKEIEHQRLLEFWFEGHRFYDLKRWYNYAEMKKVLQDREKQGVGNFKEKHYVYPIPSTEINTNTGIQQHPLWR